MPMSKGTSTSDLADLSVTTAKLAAGAVTNAKVGASAAIAYSKLAALTDGNILVGNGSNVAVSVNPSGDVDISNAGAFSIASDVVINADIKSDAAIVTSKLADSAQFALKNAAGNIFDNDLQVEKAAAASKILLTNNVATPAQNTLMGGVEFWGKDDGGADQEYAQIQGTVRDDTAGAEHGSLIIYAMLNSTMTAMLEARGDDSIVRTSANIDLAVGPTQKLWLDGGNNTSIREIGDNNVIIECNSLDILRVDTTGIQLELAATKPTFKLTNNLSVPALGTVLGGIEFWGKDDGGADQEYGQIQGLVADDEAASEDGRVYTYVFKAGAMTTALEVRGDDSAVRASTGFDLSVEQTQRVVLDGAINTSYISETSDNVVAIFQGGNLAFQAKNIGCVIGDGSTGTTRTTSFLYIPTSAGAPTGTPTANTGTVALCFDTVANTLEVYDGAWLGTVALT